MSSAICLKGSGREGKGFAAPRLVGAYAPPFRMSDCNSKVKFFISTLGCPKNTVDSRHMGDELTRQGLIPSEEQDADVILVNTCGFIRDAKEESIGEILRLAKLREQGKRLVVFGCLAERYREDLEREMPEIDGLWGVGDTAGILSYLDTLRTEGEDRHDRSGHPLTPSPAGSYAYLKVADGCDRKCTFCVIPSIRGRFRSIDAEALLEEAGELIKGGARELVLVAQDITSYGRELKGRNLASLLRGLVALPGDFWVRLLYLYPTALDDELLSLIATEEKIVKYLDIPLQHSEDRLLRLMGRRGTKKEYLKLLRKIRKAIPGVTLRTTFIVGFPTETEEEFNGLVDFIEEVRFDRLGVFAFSKEEGTPSALLKGQVPDRVKKRRLDEIMRRQALISAGLNAELVGKRFRAVIDEVGGGVAIGRLPSQAPEIDGVVIIKAVDDRQPAVGDIVTVGITGAHDYDVEAVIVAPVSQSCPILVPG